MEEDRCRRLAALVQAARAGDLQAYGRVVEQTRDAVEATARRILHDADAAEDIAQEVYLCAWDRLAELRDAGALVAWLQRSARNRALNAQRARRLSFVDDVDVAQLSAAPAAAGDSTALAHALTRLSSDDRRLCERFYHGGWPTARIAAAEGSTDAAIRKRLQRIRARLRQEMTMDRQRTDLPQRVVDLLSRPNLTALPENPVGALWEELRAHLPDFDEVALPERVDVDAARRTFDPSVPLDNHLAFVARQDGLRRDLTVPMLLTAQDHAAPLRWIAAGKAYRIEDTSEETETKLHAFHQAEILWIEEGIGQWQLFERFCAFVDAIEIGTRLQIEETDFAPQCERGWTLKAERDGQWISVCGWGRIAAGVVRRLGHDPRRVTTVGLGLGLERLAQLRYGIDDARRIAAETV